MLTRIIRDEGSQRVIITDIDVPTDEALRRLKATPGPSGCGYPRELSQTVVLAYASPSVRCRGH